MTLIKVTTPPEEFVCELTWRLMHSQHASYRDLTCVLLDAMCMVVATQRTLCGYYTNADFDEEMDNWASVAELADFFMFDRSFDVPHAHLPLVCTLT